MSPKAYRLCSAVAFLLLCLAGALPAPAELDDCVPEPPLSSSDEVLQYCDFEEHPEYEGATCDLGINSWDPPLTKKSTDIRLGDAFGPTDEHPRFFLDPDQPDYFFTKLYAQFWNLGSGYAPSEEVTVDFYYVDGEDPPAEDEEDDWILIGSYQMHHDVNDDNVLDPGPLPHQQKTAVCWQRDPDDPRIFLIRAKVNWPEEPDLPEFAANNDAISRYDMNESQKLAQIALAFDLSGSMSTEMPEMGDATRMVVAQIRASQFVDMVEDGNQLGVYGFATGNAQNSTLADVTYVDLDGDAQTIDVTETSVVAEIRTFDDASDRTAVKAGILSQTDHGCTPIGQGLLRAKKAIAETTAPSDGAGKAIVLFSDGFQNVPPFVNEERSACYGWPDMPVMSAEKTFKDEGYTIYSIYFGPGEEVWAYDDMSSIKEATGGDLVFAASDGLELSAVYYSIRGMVDDMIYLEDDGEVSGGAPSEPFTDAHRAALFDWVADGGRVVLAAAKSAPPLRASYHAPLLAAVLRSQGVQAEFIDDGNGYGYAMGWFVHVFNRSSNC